LATARCFGHVLRISSWDEEVLDQLLGSDAPIAITT
jgi:hypothetical protein